MFSIEIIHIAVQVSILGQEFQRRAINSIPFGVLASEFNVESKNMNRFAGERHDFFWSKFKGGTSLKIFNRKGPPFGFLAKKFMTFPSKKVSIFGFCMKFWS